MGGWGLTIPNAVRILKSVGNIGRSLKLVKNVTSIERRFPVPIGVSIGMTFLTKLQTKAQIHEIDKTTFPGTWSIG